MVKLWLCVEKMQMNVLRNLLVCVNHMYVVNEQVQMLEAMIIMLDNKMDAL